MDLSKDWDVNFGTPSQNVHMNQLRSWTMDEGTKFYSGVATYEKTLELPPDFLKSGSRIYLDFGAGTSIAPTGPRTPRTQAWIESPVREAALVFVNGTSAGSVWHPPYEVEVTKLLHAGKNELKIDVGNLAINALAGHAPADYRLLNSRYGERFAAQEPATLQPLPSGILGPVRLVAKVAARSPVTK
jgi:hypothetical protein